MSSFKSTIIALAAITLHGSALAQDGGPPYGCDGGPEECAAPEDVAGSLDQEWSYQSEDDWDDDGVPDEFDICPREHDPTQSDVDADGIGDWCDNCPSRPNESQSDLDGDGIGDECDSDRDGDGVLDHADNCPEVFNPLQRDIDGDGLGDACDGDMDGDGIPDETDICPFNAYPTCGRDSDGDGVPDYDLSGDLPQPLDVCPYTPDPGQLDLDQDGVGDACDSDRDGDGVQNSADNCPDVANPEQHDWDRDRIGAACDDHFCYVVAGDEESCLDPDAELQAHVPHTFGAATGEEVRLRLFANRENAALRFRWVQTGGPAGAEIENAEGAVGYSTPYEYHYAAGEVPVLVAERAGTYWVQLRIQEVFADPVTGETGETAAAEAAIEVEGGSTADGSSCACGQAIGSDSRISSLLSVLFGLLVQ
jgi:hypothetical protein